MALSPVTMCSWCNSYHHLATAFICPFTRVTIYQDQNTIHPHQAFYIGREHWTRGSVVSTVMMGCSAERTNTFFLPCWAYTTGLKHSVVLESLHRTAHTPPVQHMIYWMEIQEPHHSLFPWPGGIQLQMTNKSFALTAAPSSKIFSWSCSDIRVPQLRWSL